MTLALIAALHGHRLAAIAVAQTLIRIADDREKGRVRSGREISQRLPDRHRAEAKRYLVLARAWATRFLPSILVGMDWWQAELARSDRALSPGSVVTGDEDAQEQSGGPTLKVVAEIADIEGKSISSAYQGLTEPLPLRGGKVDPRLLHLALSLEFPHMTDAIDAIAQDLTLLRGAGIPWARLRPLLLVGAPGTGKTRLARRLGHLLGVGYAELGVAGLSDNRLLEGTARGWRDAQPCWPLLVMQQSKSANPLLLVDEIDKAIASRNGDVKATLLAMLENDTARAWFDSCLLAPADLSQVSWVLTANSLEPLPRPLLSRLRVTRVNPPGPEAFEGLLEGILHDITQDLQISRDQLPALADEAVAILRDGFARNADVRKLKRAVETLLATGHMRPPRPH
ncbi:MAG TPA: AAA family ATPase [Steroidobacteraceae bacterium]|nr:AAA family ATPase [Steroidobacteraceae bacterium]